MAHTVGPWDWKDGFQCAVGPQNDPEGNAVAIVVGHPSEAFANARLIAASPDLLAALRQTLDALYNETHGDRSPWIESVIAVANKAIGDATGEAS